MSRPLPQQRDVARDVRYRVTRPEVPYLVTQRTMSRDPARDRWTRFKLFRTYSLVPRASTRLSGRQNQENFLPSQVEGVARGTCI